MDVRHDLISGPPYRSRRRMDLSTRNLSCGNLDLMEIDKPRFTFQTPISGGAPIPIPVTSTGSESADNELTDDRFCYRIMALDIMELEPRPVIDMSRIELSYAEVALARAGHGKG